VQNMNNIQTIKTSFTNDFQIKHQLKVLEAIGVEMKFDFTYKNNVYFVTVRKIKFSESFIETKKLINNPKIGISNFKILKIEPFQLKMPNKVSLAQNAISSGFSPKNSNFERIVDNLYEQSLQSVIQEQERLTEQFTNVLNQNLIFLEEAISIFCSLHNRRLRW